MTLIEKYSHKERRSAWKNAGRYCFLETQFWPHQYYCKEIWSGISCTATAFALKTSSNIVFLKLDFDLPHIIFKKFGREFDEKSSTNDVFLKLDQDFSYVISDTNTKERSKNEKEYEINKERRRHCSSEKFSSGKKV